MPQNATLLSQLGEFESAKYKLWISGHSDGSQLAQLSALKWAGLLGPDRIGGVVLFGPSRVGSRAFANYFNSMLGDRMVYYAYGRDPASTTTATVSDVSVCWRGEGVARCLPSPELPTLCCRSEPNPLPSKQPHPP